MINPKFKAMLSARSVIRELSEYAASRGSEIGYDNVFDFSLGNPSVPVAPDYTEAVIRLHRQMDPVKLHGYSPSLGNTKVRGIVAESLKKRFGIPYDTRHIFMTSGAAGALAHALRAVTVPGEEVLVFAPFFPEYIPYINETGAKIRIVDADPFGFQINWEAFEQAMSERVAAVLINSPNNPSGVVYSEETLIRLSDHLRKCQDKYGHEIFLISDEPYREIVFDGGEVPYPGRYYDNTLSCYSFSKSLSLPGERIGYVAVNPAAKDADILSIIFGQISRGTGHNCPSSTPQLAVAEVIEETSDLSVYETNRNLLYDCMVDLGVEVIKPAGTFYIFPKAPGGDSEGFCRAALEYDLILVPSDNFGIKGYFRMAYCLDTDKVKRSLPVISDFIKSYIK